MNSSSIRMTMDIDVTANKYYNDDQNDIKNYHDIHDKEKIVIPCTLQKNSKLEHKTSVKRIHYTETYKGNIERWETDVSNHLIRSIPFFLENSDSPNYEIDPFEHDYYYTMETPLGICIMQVERKRYMYPVSFFSQFLIAKKTEMQKTEEQKQETEPISSISILHKTFDSYFEPTSFWDLQRTLTKEKPLQCFHCEKKFFTVMMLGYHQVTHMVHEVPRIGQPHPQSVNSIKQFQCAFCEKYFDTQKLRFRHQDMHDSDRKIECTYQYQCYYCDKSFSKTRYLLKHQRTHIGEKSYKCRICGKCFANRKSFLTHRELHLRTRPYQCSNCDEQFSQISYLIFHQRIHIWEKPYQCKYCDKCYTDSRHMQYHQKLHTKGRLPCV